MVVVDSFFSIGSIFLVVAILVVIVAVQQFQQNAQYREIQDRLREIRHAEMLEQQSLALRSERSAVLDPVNVLEASLQNKGLTALTTDELALVDNARKRVKVINDTLIGNRQWMGAPFDLEWHEFLDRIPIIRKAYLAANFSDAPAAADTSNATGGVPTPNLTSFSGPSAPMMPPT
ncbi:MAG: hypothetical protein EBU34_00465 [Alphaproteobacteria bacterium]|nr:hypothetical protein [Alphaproteobacteria bacterium]